MWDVSADFSASIPVGGRIACGLTVEVDGATTALHPSALSISLQEGNVRRQATATVVADTMSPAALFSLLSTELATFRSTAGFSWGIEEEQIPIFTGRAAQVVMQQASGSVTVALADFGADLAAVTCTPEIVQAASLTRRAAIAELAAIAFPGVIVVDDASDTGTLGSDQTWSGSVWDAINALAVDGLMDVAFRPDGRLWIRDMPTLGQPVTLIRSGAGGTIKSFDRTRPLDKLYNTVIVTPGTTDGSQTWQSATIDVTQLDPASRRRPALAGPRVKTVTSSTAASTEDAAAIARIELGKVLGVTETVSCELIANPAIDLYDSVSLVAQVDPQENAISVTHIVDGWNFDALAWSMSLSTRSAVEELS